jgi:hypothetical protein
MSDPIYCLVSRLPKSGETRLCNGIQIIGCSVSGKNRWVAIAEGWSAHEHGATLTPTEVLAFKPSNIHMKDGKLVEDRESAGWFDRRADLLGCPWFPPMVRRMEIGDAVLFDEIRDAYCTHNHIGDIPTGTWSELERKWRLAQK